MEPEVLHAAPRWPRPLLAKLRLHPGLSQLAAALEEKGPIPNKGRDLDQWEAELARSRAAWLAEEVLWAGLKELLRKPRPPEAEKTLKAVEEAISLAELRRAAPPLAELMPRPPAPLEHRQPLLALLEAHMGLKADELRGYGYGAGIHGAGIHGAGIHGAGIHGAGIYGAGIYGAGIYGAGIYGAGIYGAGIHGAGIHGAGIHGAGIYGAGIHGAGCGPAMGLERSRLMKMKERKWELMGQLEECKAACTQSHSSCVSLLLSLVSVRCRRRRVELRRHLYLQAKATAMLLKARLEELTLLLDTYSPEHVEAHGNIRSQLEAALSGSQLELASLRVTLGSYESLGPVMADAAQQYRDLRDRIHNRHWALQHMDLMGIHQ